MLPHRWATPSLLGVDPATNVPRGQYEEHAVDAVNGSEQNMTKVQNDLLIGCYDPISQFVHDSIKSPFPGCENVTGEAWQKCRNAIHETLEW